MIVLIRKDRSELDLDKSEDQPGCRLLTLPAELRNQIWRHILIQDTGTQSLLPVHRPLTTPRDVPRFCANVLRTCKQINTEGTPILYAENIFSAHTNLLASLPSFLLSIRPRRLSLPPVVCGRVVKLIRRYHVFVRLDTDPRFSRSQVEESFNHADSLEIEVFQSMYGSSDFTVLRLFEGVRGVGKVDIHGSLGDRRYADWLEAAMQLNPGDDPAPFWEKYVGGQRAWDAWSHGTR